VITLQIAAEPVKGRAPGYLRGSGRLPTAAANAVILEQHYLACLAQASYFVCDERTKTAVVVDPRRDVDLYVERARELGATIRFVLLTHFHADFAAGHLELARRTGAVICLGSVARPAFEHRAFADGEELVLGDVRIRCLHTPGHTPESVSWLVFDGAQSRTEPRCVEPYGVLTGDTLFVGDVGRPDLLTSVGVTAEELASRLFDSLHTKLLTLPDSTRVLPGHGPGSMCGRALGNETTSTIGKERATNWALAPHSREEFVRELTAGIPCAPAYFAFDASYNQGAHDTLEAVIERARAPLGAERILALHASGTQILDVRSSDEFARGHLPGSINAGLDGKFATWAGSVLDGRQSIAIVAPRGQELEAATRLGRIGFDRIVGHLAGGAESLATRTDLAHTTRYDPRELPARLARGNVVLVDVRAASEHDTCRVAGAKLVPLPALTNRLAELPRDTELCVICAGGYRSSVAASHLRAHGFTNVTDVRGGMAAVEKSPSGLALERAPVPTPSSC
jgi:glyoxylase-like metal-dependent hydrolase (beta-lactamase superfamily II)/rhodanese-related sulfurtransferase